MDRLMEEFARCAAGNPAKADAWVTSLDFARQKRDKLRAKLWERRLAVFGGWVLAACALLIVICVAGFALALARSERNGKN